MERDKLLIDNHHVTEIISTYNHYENLLYFKYKGLSIKTYPVWTEHQPHNINLDILHKPRQYETSSQAGFSTHFKTHIFSAQALAPTIQHSSTHKTGCHGFISQQQDFLSGLILTAINP